MPEYRIHAHNEEGKSVYHSPAGWTRDWRAARTWSGLEDARVALRNLRQDKQNLVGLRDEPRLVNRGKYPKKKVSTGAAAQRVGAVEVAA